MNSLLRYNQYIFDKLYVKYNKQACFQLGFFNKNYLLFLGINPGMPYTNDLRKKVDVVLEQTTFSAFQTKYEESIRSTLMGTFIKKIVGDDWSMIGLTNIVKIATSSNLLPTSTLVKEFLPITKKQIELFQPNVVLCLGKFAGSFFNLTTFYKSRKINKSRYILVPHPSYLFRTGMIDVATVEIKNILNDIKTCQNEFLKPTQPTLSI